MAKEKEKGKCDGLLCFLLALIVVLILVIGGGAYYFLVVDNGEEIANEGEEFIENVSIKNNAPNEKEVIELISTFLNMISVQEAGFEHVLSIIGYNNYEEIAGTAVQSSLTGDMICGYLNNAGQMVAGYSNTKIKYSDFEEKIFNYVDWNVLRQQFSHKFMEDNGLLYAKVGNASGYLLSNIRVKLMYTTDEQFVYKVNSTYSDEIGNAEVEFIISICKHHINNKYVVSGFIEL